MSDPILTRSNFNVTVSKRDDRLQTTSPITVKNQIQEVRSIDQLGLNITNRADGSFIIYNANTGKYDVRPPYIITAAGYGLASNNTHYYVNSKTGLTANSSGLYVNSAYIATVYVNTANNSTHVFGKNEADLSVGSAVYSTYLGGEPASYFLNASNFNAGVISETLLPYRMNQDITNISSVQFNDLTVTGFLTVSGGINTIQSNNISTSDSMIYLNNGTAQVSISRIIGNGSILTFTANNTFSVGSDVSVSGVNPSSFNGVYVNVLSANSTQFTVANTNTSTYIGGGLVRAKSKAIVDLGFSAGYYDGSHRYGGIFRDHTNGTWKVFDNLTSEPDRSVYIDQGDSSFRTANFMANTLIVGNGTIFSTITSSSFSGTSNNTVYAFGKGETDLNVNTAIYLNGKTDTYFSNASNLKTGILSSNIFPIIDCGTY